MRELKKQNSKRKRRKYLPNKLGKSKSTNRSMVKREASQKSTTTSRKPKSKIEDYKLDKLLGKGSYALVKLAKHIETGKLYAIKTYERRKLRDPLKKASVEREISLLKRLDNEYIIRYVEHIVTQKQIHLVMEYAGTRSLYEYVKKGPKRRLNHPDAVDPFRQLCKAVAYCHSKHIAHRDLKLENVIFNRKGEVKLIDFGFAVYSKNKLRTFCGTPTYMAPEIVKKRQYKGSKVDIWALGVLLYRMVTGTYPFKAKKDKELYHKISIGKYDSSIIPDKRIRDLISKMLVVKPNERISILGVLKHDWLNQSILKENGSILSC